MTRDELQRWLDEYLAAWRSSDAAQIGALFSDEAVYSFRPWESEEVTVRGRDAIVASWLDSPDEPGSWEAQYEPFAVEGPRAAAVGWSRYFAVGDQPEKLYHNVFLLGFDDDGRCSSFHEFYMLQS